MAHGRIKATASCDWYLLTNYGTGIPGGHDATFRFLEKHRHLMTELRTGSGFTTLAIEAGRLAKFVDYANRNEIEIELS
jgi:hypothetical protein